MAARMKAFDRTVDSTTGDLWRLAADSNPPDFVPLEPGPGGERADRDPVQLQDQVAR
jgi:hypothetical protein